MTEIEECDDAMSGRAVGPYGGQGDLGQRVLPKDQTAVARGTCGWKSAQLLRDGWHSVRCESQIQGADVGKGRRPLTETGQCRSRAAQGNVRVVLEGIW